ARCCATSIACWPRKRACPCWWPRTRSPAWCGAAASRWKTWNDWARSSLASERAQPERQRPFTVDSRAGFARQVEQGPRARGGPEAVVRRARAMRRVAVGAAEVHEEAQVRQHFARV